MEPLTIESIRASFQSDFSPTGLRALRDQWTDSVRGLFASSPPLEWNRMINDIHDEMIRQIIAISERELAEKGFGAPPLPYAFVLLGSGGRREQTLWSDQDNGIIIDDQGTPLSSEEEMFYEALAKQISGNLQIAGYPLCEGYVLCTSSRWRKALLDWQTMCDRWFAEPVWEHIRYVLIMADLRCIHGDPLLVRRLYGYFQNHLAGNRSLMLHLLNNTLHHKVPINMFGGLVTQRYGDDAGGLDIKYGAYIPFVNSIRLLAIHADIEATSTTERLARLREMGTEPQELLDACLDAFAWVLKFRSMTPYQVEEGAYTSRGYLPLTTLSKEERLELKHILRTGAKLQKYVKGKIEKSLK